MELSIATPALLFPTISLLMLAYTNRFLALASLIRKLHDQYRETRDSLIVQQITNLRHRVLLIRNMQALGILSLLCCVLCMFLIYEGWQRIGELVFGVALLLLISSLMFSLREIQLSVVALNLQLSDMEQLAE
jgi:hypothetical protein